MLLFVQTIRVFLGQEMVSSATKGLLSSLEILVFLSFVVIVQ